MTKNERQVLVVLARQMRQGHQRVHDQGRCVYLSWMSPTKIGWCCDLKSCSWASRYLKSLCDRGLVYKRPRRVGGGYEITAAGIAALAENK